MRAMVALLLALHATGFAPALGQGATDEELKKRFLEEYPPAAKRLELALLNAHGVLTVRKMDLKKMQWRGGDRVEFAKTGDLVRIKLSEQLGNNSTGETADTAIVTGPENHFIVNDPETPRVKLEFIGEKPDRKIVLKSFVYFKKFFEATCHASWREDPVYDWLERKDFQLGKVEKVGTLVKVSFQDVVEDNNVRTITAAGFIEFSPDEGWSIRKTEATLQVLSKSPQDPKRVDHPVPAEGFKTSLEVKQTADGTYTPATLNEEVYGFRGESLGSNILREKYEGKFDSWVPEETPLSAFTLGAFGLSDPRSKSYLPIILINAALVLAVAGFLLYRRHRIAGVGPSGTMQSP